MVHRLQSPTVLLVIALCLCDVVAAPAPAAAEDAPRNTKPYTRYKVLLGQLINGTLPFDVPFIIWGEVDGTMTDDLPQAEVTLKNAEFRSSEVNCKAVPPGDYKPLRRAAVSKWTDQDFTDRELTVPTDPIVRARHQFEMLIPPLEPRRVYCFLFEVSPGKSATSGQALALGRAIEPAYQAFLRDVGVLKELGDEDAERLRQKLIGALFEVAAIRDLTPRRESVFDPKADPRAVAGPFRAMWTAVQLQHNRAVGKLAAFQSLSAGTAKEAALRRWEKWRRSPELARLARGPGSARLAASELQAFAQLPEGDAASWLVGVPTGTPVTVITDLWHVDRSIGSPSGFTEDDSCPRVPPLAERCQTLDDVRARLTRTVEGLREMAATAPEKPPAPASPRAPVALSRAEVSSLADAVADTAADLADQKVTLLEVQLAVNSRHDAMLRHVNELQLLIPTTWYSIVTTDGNLATRRSWYVSADTGLAVGVSINEVLPYLGSNFYFRPVNTEAPPGKFLTRFSALAGFTWTDNILKEGERESLYGTSVSLVLGAGLRLTEVLKVSGGVLMFKGLDPNPSIVESRLELSPFVSISGDFDVAKLLGGLFSNDAEAPKTLGAGTPPER